MIEISKRSKPSVTCGRKKGKGACRLCFDAAHPGYRILVSWSGWSDRWLLTSERWVLDEWIPHFAKNTHVHANVTEANEFKRKKHHNLMGRITLLACWWQVLQDKCKWADGRHQSKVYRILCLFFPPGHARFTSLADILFHPAPLESLFAD